MMTRSHPNPRSVIGSKFRGFATVIALITVGLIGVTLGTLITHISNQARRTVDESERAQLRQLATAGEAAPSPAAIHLPAALVKDGYSLTIQSKIVIAKKGEHSAVGHFPIAK